MSRLKAVVGNHPWKVLGATTFLGVGTYKKLQTELRLGEDAKKKKVLVLPFHRMKIVEEKKSPISSLANRFSGSVESPGADGVIEMQADELITLIREASEDPSIVSLYGIFGSGGTMSTGGWAHLEEIRNALELFAKPAGEKEDSDRKAMYAYSNTFGGQQSMAEYYLASVFPVIHLQPQGDLNLYGLHSTSTFFRGFLKKYGIKAHVWKHGAYKNMANMFTHSYYSKEHYENTAGYLLPIHQHVRRAIYDSRRLQQYGYNFDKFWRMIENAGSFPADVAHEIGFVDHLPLKDPLDKLVKNNKQPKAVAKESAVKTNVDTDANSTADTETSDSSDDQEENKIATEVPVVEAEDGISSLVNQWKLNSDPESFTADAKINIDAYARKKAIERRKKAGESESVMDQLSSLLGSNEEKKNSSKEKIAVIKINGAIGETVARKAEKALRKVKDEKDVKCVVLRVDSRGGAINACESIYQEIQDLPQKVVVSFGNVSASGGYYISSSADQIFASSTTITGSIGVVLVRMNFRDLAKSYGITFDSVPTSALSGSNDPFFPINKKMEENYANQAHRFYHHFKSLVSDGRDMDMKAVEKVAKGRVWTGAQAHEIGLVDKLGGLEEAIAFAQKNYTESGDAQVVQWPPKKSFWEFLATRGQEDGADDIEDVEMPTAAHALFSVLSSNGNNRFASILRSSGIGKGYSPSLSAPVTSGVMLTLDENTAIQCMLEESKLSDKTIPFDEILNSIL